MRCYIYLMKLFVICWSKYIFRFYSSFLPPAVFVRRLCYHRECLTSSSFDMMVNYWVLRWNEWLVLQILQAMKTHWALLCHDSPVVTFFIQERIGYSNRDTFHTTFECFFSKLFWSFSGEMLKLWYKYRLRNRSRSRHLITKSIPIIDWRTYRAWKTEKGSER